MKRTALISSIVILLIFSQCSTVPLTGRRQLAILPESEMISMGLTSYQEFLKENKVSADQKLSSMVSSTGTRLSDAVTRYLSENGLQNRLDGYQWVYTLVDSDVPNAFCLPGGKVVVYSGILPFTSDETGLAVVISHEIAHAVARHGNERMSQQLLVQMGGIALSEAIKTKPDETKAIYGTVYGMGAQLGVILPYSREHEYEADRLGIIFMAMAGYDPSAAVAFWDRMSKIGGEKPPEFMSTHPSDARRVAAIREALPEAMKYYRK